MEPFIMTDKRKAGSLPAGARVRDPFSGAKA